jgi:hypothetical protein
MYSPSFVRPLLLCCGSKSLDIALGRVSDGAKSSEGVTVVLLHQRQSDDVMEHDARHLALAGEKLSGIGTKRRPKSE